MGPFRNKMCSQRSIRHEIDLVEHSENWFFSRAQGLQGFENCFLLQFPVQVARIHNVNDEIRKGDFFQSGSKRGNEMRRQVADKANRIGEKKAITFRQIDLSGGGIEGCKWHRIGEEIGAGEAIHEGGLPRACVANDGGERKRMLSPARALLIADPCYIFNFLLEF